MKKRMRCLQRVSSRTRNEHLNTCNSRHSQIIRETRRIVFVVWWYDVDSSISATMKRAIELLSLEEELKNANVERSIMINNSISRFVIIHRRFVDKSRRVETRRIDSIVVIARESKIENEDEVSVYVSSLSKSIHFCRHWFVDAWAKFKVELRKSLLIEVKARIDSAQRVEICSV